MEFRGVLKELDGSGPIRKQARCSAKPKVLGASHQLFGFDNRLKSHTHESISELWGPRELSPEESERRAILYNRATTEQIQEMRENKWRAAIISMLDRKRKHRKPHSASHIAKIVGCDTWFVERVKRSLIESQAQAG